jgi:predicted AlkP superfamily pyrophosphatase or phosphodiesterase
VDGGRWDYLQDDRLVHLHGMLEQGASASQVIVTTPSMTGPGHVTLLTGAWSGTHGIVFNKFFDREKGFVKFLGGIPVEEQTDWLLAEPLWASAERAGLETSAVHWMATAGEFQGLKVDHVVPFDAAWSNQDRVAKGIEILVNEKPDLLLIYTNGVSPESYTAGAGSQAALDAMVEMDGLVGKLRMAIQDSGLAGSTTLIVASDHGFGPPLERELCLSWLLDQNDIGYEFILWGGIGHVFLSEPADADEVAALIEPLEGVKRVVLGKDAADLHLATENRTGDVLVVMQPGYQVANMWRECDAPVVDPQPGYELAGTHGQPAIDDPDMRGIFAAVGPGILNKDLGVILQVDIAPTVCALLGIEPPAQADGKALQLKE